MIKQSVLDNLTRDAFYLIYGLHYEGLRCMAQMSITWWARKMLVAELQMKIGAVGSPWYHDKRIKLEKGENWRKIPFHWLWFKASLYIECCPFIKGLQWIKLSPLIKRLQ